MNKRLPNGGIQCPRGPGRGRSLNSDLNSLLRGRTVSRLNVSTRLAEQFLERDPGLAAAHARLHGSAGDLG